VGLPSQKTEYDEVKSLLKVKAGKGQEIVTHGNSLQSFEKMIFYPPG
jgi:hypothetical protein